MLLSQPKFVIIAIACCLEVSSLSKRNKKTSPQTDIFSDLDLNADFLSYVSHELKTPLTLINEGVNLISDGTVGAVDEEQLHLLDLVNHNVERLSERIDDLIDFLRIESGVMSVNSEPLDIKDEIDKAIIPFKNLANHKTIILEKSVRVRDKLAFADSEKFRKILNNLISNAVKFTHTGGHITVKVSVHEEDKSFMCVDVSDNGVGIDDKSLNKIFNQFGKVNGKLVENIRGSGLGLTLSKKLVELIGGKIWVQSTIGKGTSFSFTLPFCSESP